MLWLSGAQEDYQTQTPDKTDEWTDKEIVEEGDKETQKEKRSRGREDK